MMATLRQHACGRGDYSAAIARYVLAYRCDGFVDPPRDGQDVKWSTQVWDETWIAGPRKMRRGARGVGRVTSESPKERHGIEAALVFSCMRYAACVHYLSHRTQILSSSFFFRAITPVKEWLVGHVSQGEVGRSNARA